MINISKTYRRWEDALNNTMINLYKLEIFTAVVQTGAMNAAAERLLMTQPAVSQHIHDLEASLGARLLCRGPRGVTLTDEGETLYRYARAIFRLVSEAENAVTDVRNLSAGQITLGATPGVGIYLLPEWIQEFRSIYANLTVGLQTGITSQILTDLRAGRIDLGFIEGELDSTGEAWLGVLHLGDYEQMVIIGAKHPWHGRQEVTIDELGSQTFVVRQRNSQTRIWLDDVLRNHGVTPKIGAEFDAMESIKRAVAMGTCLTILPEYVVKSEIELGMLTALPVSGRPFQRTLKLIWNQERFFSPIVWAFLEHLSQRLEVLRPLVESHHTLRKEGVQATT